MTGNWTVDSAGTWAAPGMQVLPEVSLIARRYGIDLTRHRSKPVTETILAAHDLILVMETGHREALQNEFPACEEHIYLLSQVVEERTYDIPDLIDSVETISEVGENLHRLIHTGFTGICRLATRLARRSQSI